MIPSYIFTVEHRKNPKNVFIESGPLIKTEAPKQFPILPNCTYYIKIANITIYDYPRNASYATFHIKSNWTGASAILAVFGVRQTSTNYKAFFSDFSEIPIIHLITNASPFLEISINQVLDFSTYKPRDLSNIKLNLDIQLFKKE